MLISWFEVFLLTGVLYMLLKFWFNGKLQRFRDLGINFIQPTFLMGNFVDTFLSRRNMTYQIEDIYKAFPDDRFVVYFEMASPVILVRDLDLVKNIAIGNFDKFPDHRVTVDGECDTQFGKMLFQIKGNIWRDMRSTMTPAFTPIRIKKMSVRLFEAAKQLQQHFQDRIEEQRINGYETKIKIEGKEVFTAYFNDLIAMAGFGLNINSFEDSQKTFLKNSIRLTDLDFLKLLKFSAFSVAPNLMKFLKIPFIDKDVAEYFQNIVSSTLKEREENDIQKSDFLDLIIKVRKGALEKDTSAEVNTFVIADENLKKEDIRIKGRDWSVSYYAAQLGGFMIAGLDTGSSSLANLFYELAMNQDIQKRLQNEIDETIAAHGELTYEAIQKMDYLTMVISESLRKYSAGAPVMDRLCHEDYNIGPPRPGGIPYTIRKGDGVAISSYAIHRDPKYWPNPDKFDPERFSKENRINIIPYTYMPFGIGPRMCIGFRFGELALKLGTVFMLSTFDVIPTEKTPEVLEFSPKSLTIKSYDYHYALRPRQK